MIIEKSLMPLWSIGTLPKLIYIGHEFNKPEGFQGLQVGRISPNLMLLVQTVGHVSQPYYSDGRIPALHILLSNSICSHCDNLIFHQFVVKHFTLYNNFLIVNFNN